MNDNKPVRVVQLSDCHLSGDTEQLFRGINPYSTLQRVMERIKQAQPDLLLASGDLSEDGSAASYRLLQDQLRSPGVPVLTVPGNHDDPQALAEAFPGSPVSSIAVSEHGAWQLIRMNSCIPDRPEGRIADAALDELEEHLNVCTPKPTLLALHHQPVATGSPWIDKYPLLEPGRLLGLIDQHAHVRVVVWGHIHQVFSAQRNGTQMLGCPSTAINGRVGEQRFTPDTLGPAFRWLDLYPDGSIETRI